VSALVYDCFADATFSNLSTSSTGSLQFTVLIYAYNYATYNGLELKDGGPSESTATAASAAATTINTWPVDAGPRPNPFVNIPANWTSNCQASECVSALDSCMESVDIVALCSPLALGSARTPQADAGADSAPTGDGATEGSPEGSPEGSTEASTDGAGGDALPSDASGG
jgi:hypothetical protein